MPRGSTLTEVLVSLLIMSIGIVSLTTMFPLSVLRSLKATNLTKGTDLRRNAEAMIDLYPRMVTDPDLNPATPNSPEYFVVDPLGWNFVNQAQIAQGLAVGVQNTFGNDNGNPYPPVFFLPTVNSGGMSRYNFGRNTLDAADYLVTLPDSWIVEYEGDYENNSLTVGNNAAGYTQLNVVGLAAAGIPDPSLFGPSTVDTPRITYRAVIEGTDGRSNHVRFITHINGDTIYWTEDIDNDDTLDTPGPPNEDKNANNLLDKYALPGYVTAGLPGPYTPLKVRIEAQDRRYTWLLSCRRLNGITEVDVVVLFGRSADNPLDQEALYPAAWSLGGKSFTVDYTNLPKPLAKAGGFLLDIHNARWYRIASVIPDPGNPTGYIVGIEIPTFAPPPAAGRVMFPKAVVDVYPLGQKP